MPTYEYDCEGCGARLEFFQSMLDAPKEMCPRCGAPCGLKRRVGAGAGIIFRGNGFYCTDYRSDSYRSKAKSDAGTAPGGNGEAKKEPAKEGAKVTQTEGTEA